MVIAQVIKWNAPPDMYAWKFPTEEISNWSQLLVNESQEAVVVSNGQMEGPFGPGRHALGTENMPVLSGMLGSAFGRSPFTAEVWFVNRAIALDVKWGTSEPIQLQDPKYNIMLPVRAFGQYGLQIEHTKKFLVKLTGTLPVFSREQLVSYFRGLMLTRVKDAIAKRIVQQRISILEISASLSDISEALRNEITAEMAEYGLRLVSFYVNSINTPEDDPAVQKLKAALAKRAEMDILGYTYQQERSFDTLNLAANNESSAGAPLMGAAMGLGMGMPFGQMIGQAMGQAALHMQPGLSVSPAPTPAAAPQGMACDKCGTRVLPGARFCPHCGDPFVGCPSCGADNSADAPNCTSCGKPMPQKCNQCGGEAPGGVRFCPHCGNSLLKTCTGCQTPVAPGSKFCGACGTPI
ncbi:MAG: SPFH domain-containing protein [Pseudomonadota bacterium]